ncbi:MULTISPECIES: hypothetical protein [unclassified Novosphingobium]|uniref:hypothetical protein n=1 Tax=unclassified Novosphingobium TaxID=2644732 RepID=UPI000EEC017A|nr:MULTISPECIES: hypothetical protein [unclassified Novosphingobium]HCF24104.1 hypothetical protein [Novosphingobium sp.]HQV04115.1 hypothetical protein [Novosphingobium sp.]
MHPTDLPPRPSDIAAPAFIPVPLSRVRHDGWTVPRQCNFLRALSVTGSVSSAARMVGMSRKAAYALRGRSGAESFAAAWDRALSEGQARAFDWLMERALNGVTTITLRTGGAVEVGHGPDRRLVGSPFRPGPRGSGGRPQKVT